MSASHRLTLNTAQYRSAQAQNIIHVGRAQYERLKI